MCIITPVNYINNPKKDEYYTKMDKKITIDMPKIIKNEHLISVDGIYTMFEACRDSEFYFGGECHSAWQMVYVLDSAAGITADDRVYLLTAGSVIFHQPMEFHKIWSEQGSRPKTFIVSFDMQGELAHKLKKGVYKLWEQPKAIMDAIITILRKAGKFPYEQADGAYEVRYDGVTGEPFDDGTQQTVMGLLENFFLCLALSDGRGVKTLNGGNVKLYTEIVRILEDSVYGNITISEISKRVGASEATVKKCFSEYAGCGIHKYFLKIKIRTAIEHLSAGKTVSEVSDLLGFSGANYFSIVFKRETGGKTPSSYRRRA